MKASTAWFPQKRFTLSCSSIWGCDRVYWNTTTERQRPLSCTSSALFPYSFPSWRVRKRITSTSQQWHVSIANQKTSSNTEICDDYGATGLSRQLGVVWSSESVRAVVDSGLSRRNSIHKQDSVVRNRASYSRFWVIEVWVTEKHLYQNHFQAASKPNFGMIKLSVAGNHNLIQIVFLHRSETAKPADTKARTKLERVKCNSLKQLYWISSLN